MRSNYWRCIFWLLLALLLAAARPARSAERISSYVASQILTVQPHGISYQQAQGIRLSERAKLLEILVDKKQSRFWVNAIVAIGFQENPATLPPLIEFFEQSGAPDNLFELRAHLAIPFAIGAVAANAKDDQALEFLLRELNTQSEALSTLTPDSMGWRRLEQIIVALAVSTQPRALAALNALKSRINALPEQSAAKLSWLEPITQAESLAKAILTEGRANYFSRQLTADSPKVSTASSARDLPAPLLIGARRHVEAIYSNADFDLDLATATQLLFNRQTGCASPDVACPVSFARSGDIALFGSVGDGLNHITTEAELNSVLSVPGARVKFVDAIDYCGSSNPSIIACANTPGSSMVIETGYSGSIVFAHEYGHNRGLNHRDDCINNLMRSSVNEAITQGVVNASECSAFGGGGVTLTLDLQFDGRGTGSVLVTPPGSSCQANCLVDVPFGADVSIDLTPNAGSRAGGCSNGCSFSATSGLSKTVRFLSMAEIASFVHSIRAGPVPDVLFSDGFD